MKTTVILNFVFPSYSIVVAASILWNHQEPELGDVFCLGLVGEVADISNRYHMKRIIETLGT